MNYNVNEIYDLLGDDTIKLLVDRFYDRIDKDELLRPMFPKELKYGRKFQYLFLKQIFGGPREYNELRGHPMMRKRHFPFKIGLDERNRWMDLMTEAMDEIGIDGDIRKVMDIYFNTMATKIINKEKKNQVSFHMK